MSSGRVTGDLTHPILFIPEFYKQEFKSKVADMRNSVTNRMNAQSSCAGQFIYNHLQDVNPAYLHLDIARPAFRDGRAPFRLGTGLPLPRHTDCTAIGGRTWFVTLLPFLH